MDFNGDKNVENNSDQYMFGSSLMVCPVYEYEARKRNVYFPKSDNWYDFYTGKQIKGGQTLLVNAPYDKIPLYVRAGSIVPFGPQVQHTANQPETLTFYIYGGKDGSFELYEDEGTNYKYEKGKFSRIPLAYNDNSKTVIIGKREGEFDGMLKNRTINFILVDSQNQIGYNNKNKSQKIIEYKGDQIEIKF